MIFKLFRSDPRRKVIEALYGRITDAARRPALYTRLGVPDTLEGRFEALTLHALLVLRRLRRLPPPADDVAQDLINHLFRQLDYALREMGVGATRGPKRMRTLGEAFYGRARSYDPALDARDEGRLGEALARNITGEDGAPLAAYALAADAALAELDLDTLLDKGPVFPEPDHIARE